MIGIKVNGGFLDLFDDTEINFKWSNPIFADDGVIPGSFSIPFDIPFGEKSPTNSRLLLNADVISNPEGSKQFDAELYFDGLFFRKGLLNVEKARDTAAVNFKSGISILATKLKTMRLKDITNQTVEMVTPHTYTKKVLISCVPNGEPFSLTINGVEVASAYIGIPGFSHSLDLAAQINAHPETNATAIYHPYSFFSGVPDHFEVQNSANANDINAPLTIDIGDEKTFRWRFDASSFESEYNDPIKAWLNNYNQADPPDSALRFGLLKNSLLYKDEKKLINSTFTVFSSDKVNLVNTDGFILNKPVGGSNLVPGITIVNPVNYTNVSPFVRVKYILDRISNSLNLSIEGDFLDDPDFQNYILVHSNCIETPIEFVGSVKWLATRSNFNVNEFVPDMKVSDFLKELQTRFSLAIYLNEKSGRLMLQNREQIISNLTATDITEYALRPDPIELNSTITGIRLKAKKDKDTLAVDDVIEIGVPEDEITTEFSSPYQQGNILYGGSGYTQLDALIFNSVYLERELDKDIPSIIGVYAYKASLDGSSTPYPALTVNGSIDYRFAGDNGLFEKRWKGYVRFLLNRKTLPVGLDLPFRILSQLEWNKKLAVEGVKYLVKDLDITMTMKGLNPIGANLYTVGLGTLPTM